MDSYFASTIFINSIITIITFFVVYFVARRFIDRTLAHFGSKFSKKRLAYIKSLRNFVRWILVFVCILVVLRTNGVDISSTLAGLGIASVISGLALQDVLKDIIASFNLTIDKYFSVGDVVKINNIRGEVVEMRVRVTKFRDIDDGHIFTVANRNISEALVLSTQTDLDIPLPYETDLEISKKVLDDIIEEIKKFENVENVEYKNIADFGDSAIFYRIRIFAHPKMLPQITRDARALIKLKLDKNNISIPYQQIVIHSTSKTH